MSRPDLIGARGDTLREAFGRALAALLPEFEKVVVLDGDVAGGTGTHHVRTAHPDRFVQLGIAEQNLVCTASGLAATGLVPVVATFAAFALRAYEQTRLSVAYARRNVKIVASHPGLDAGPDGASVQALEDLAAHLALPGFVVVSPADPIETEQATRAILEHEGPVYMRTGRSPARRIFDPSHRFELGRGMIVRDGGDLSIVACGVQVARALDAAEILARDGIAARVVNMATLKPLDVDLLVRCAEETGAILTSEDHNRLNGLGAQVARALGERCPVPLRVHGVDDEFGESGEPEELARRYGLDGESLAREALVLLSRKRLGKGLRRVA
jgi:transketolase